MAQPSRENTIEEGEIIEIDEEKSGSIGLQSIGLQSIGLQSTTRSGVLPLVPTNRLGNVSSIARPIDMNITNCSPISCSVSDSDRNQEDTSPLPSMGDATMANMDAMADIDV